MRRLLLAALVALLLSLWAEPAYAHPLGNFTVNVYTGVRVQSDRLVIDLVVDMAEIPAFQARRTIDGDSDDRVSEVEGRTYAATACADAAVRLDVSVSGRAVPVQSSGTEVRFPPGTAGLATLRLTCALEADTGPVSEDHELSVRNRNYDDRVGWREIVAVGDGTTLVSSDVGRRSISRRLTSYPEGMLQSPLDQRSVTIRARPGGAGAPSGFGPDAAGGGGRLKGVDRATQWFTELVGRQELTPAFGLLAFVVSVVLGSLHALAPGHGKTIMAAYLVGQRGSSRHALLIGLTVTATHTAGVLVLGVVLSAFTTLAPERAFPWLGLASGLLLVAVGAGLLRSAMQRRIALATNPVLASVGARDVHGADHADEPHRHDADGHGHDHHGDHHHGEHRHGFGHHHHHHPPPNDLSRRGLVVMGLAGGLVPSPSALVVLLGAIALGQAWFGVALVVGYGVGMAAALTVAGLLLVRFRIAFDRRVTFNGGSRVTFVVRLLPVVTAGLVLGGGVLISIRALGQM